MAEASSSKRGRSGGGKRLRRLAAVAVAFGAMLLLLVLVLPTRTPPFRDARGKIVPGSVARMEMLEIGGIQQRVWIRGLSTRNPPLILLHGGPGASESPLFRAYAPELERHFLVIYWDQRGAGRSFSGAIPASSMTIHRFVADLDELVNLIRRRYGIRPVYLLGHSWGTVVGLLYAQRHPEKVGALISAAPAIDYPKAERLGWEWALMQAKVRGDREAIAELSGIGPPPHDVDKMFVSRKWVEHYGGSFHQDMSTGDLILASLRLPEMNLWDLVLFGRGNRWSLERLWPELRTLDLSSLRRLEVPVFFLLGRYDWQVPSVVAADYFGALSAPCKELVWFEQSAHNLPFEEPAKFVRTVAAVPAKVAFPACARSQSTANR